ncbi:hypothetical protein [Kaistia sp. MMO-174]|uniref:hypothetical protein n=1 Tax=Kaistia sp. MMO-174 TaxID=3081256 RepID=UPI003016D3D8
MNDCLHCHLMASMLEWLNEKAPKSDDGRPEIGSGAVIAASVKVLCDAIEAESTPGEHREQGTDLTIKAIRKVMADRMLRDRFDEPAFRH